MAADRGDEFEALEEAIPDLIRLDRYERRAWSQQQHAIREFLNIKMMQNIDRATKPCFGKKAG
jgi:hypothetical protein